MSCQIQVTANLLDTATIRRNLFPADDLRGGDAWLQSCVISVSPTGDIIVLGHKTKIVVLAAKWNSSSALCQFVSTYSGTLNDSENVRAIACLPIVGQTQSSHVGPDWTCIMVGFDSGYVRFYTENCELLLEEQLHNEAIVNVKCQSQHSPRPDIWPEVRVEEIYVHYQSNLCVISGNQLFPLLRACRTQLARVQARGESIDLTQTPLNPKKWGFQDQATVNDMEVVGLNLTNTFDHLLTASLCGGFDAKYRTAPPHNTLVMAVGARPFVGFHYALEGGNVPVLSDVAKAVASKLKSALPGWLMGTKSQIEKQLTVAMQPAEPMGCRFGLCDMRRTGLRVILSPDHRLGAVSDALGRVMLMDTFRGTILRIFKGYREAQCSFLQVPQETKSSKTHFGNKVALFLVIYSPKKGTVEIFTVQQGSKVTTFTASKHSRLLYVNYGLMGYERATKSRYVCQFTTVFIDNDGLVKEIVVPFHFALPEKNNKRAKDIHLYKKLRQSIKNESESDPGKLSEEAYKACTELQTMEIMTQTVEMLITNKTVSGDVIMRCVEYFIGRFKEEQLEKNEEGGEEEAVVESSGLRLLCENIRDLLGFYLYVTSRVRVVEEGNSCIISSSTSASTSGSGDSSSSSVVVDTDSEKNVLKDTKITLGAKELSNLQTLIDLNVNLNVTDKDKKSEARVLFADQEEFSVSDLLSLFVLNSSDGNKLKANIDTGKLFKTSEVFFKKFITEPDELVNTHETLESVVSKSRITTKDLFKLVINYWVNRSLDSYVDIEIEKEMNNLYSVIHTIVKISDCSEIIVDYSEVSGFWSEIREILAESAKPFPALTAAIVSKLVAHNIEMEANSGTTDQSGSGLEDESIEILSQENCEWTLLIGKLEDISLLNIILSKKPASTDCTLPPLNHDTVNVSLNYVLENGKGSVSELVSKWLTSIGVNPYNIVVNDRIHAQKQNSTQEEDEEALEDIPKEKINQVKSQTVFNHLNLMRSEFPYSLEPSRLLANMCWEYCLAWQKDVQNLGNLEASMKCLREITSPHILQGLHNLIWSTHLKVLFENASKLINKVGKLPKERFCRQDTGLADYQVTLFIEICTNFLDGFLDIVQASYNTPKTPLKYEQLWENGTQQPLVELAQQHSQINYELLMLHYQLSVCLQMMTTFFIKQSKPIQNLFDSSLLSLFFSDLQRKVELDLRKTNTKLNFTRTEFLVKVISASLETVTINESNEPYIRDHVKWMAECVNIARMWELDIDFLKRYQVVNLYASGFDVIATELLAGISERSKLGPELLVVAGKRLSHYMASVTDYAAKLPALSTYLTEYLNTLNSGYYCAPSKLENIKTLASQILPCLKPTQPEYRLAEHLLEACSTLIDLQDV